jgi:cAMP-dependent protein kinase regulator
MRTLKDLHEYADDHLYAGRYAEALHGYAAEVQLNPTSLDGRLRIADCLLALGEPQAAAMVYTKLAQYAAHAGYPLRALVALKVLQALEPQLGQLLAGVATLYAKDSPKLGRGVRLSLGDPDALLPDGLRFDTPPPLAELATHAARNAMDTSRIAAFPEKVNPIPVFSELPADNFAAVLGALRLVRARPGQVIIEQGSVGTSFFVLARGEVQVQRTRDDGAVQRLAKLHDGSIFGEMALVSAQPRSATVVALDDCDLLEFPREALVAASSQVGAIATALEKFTRERLLNNLLATSPLFRPLDTKQRLDLVRGFAAHDLAPGTTIIREGEQGRGLFLLLSGEADVSKVDGSERVLLATLKPGDVFGEIALIHNEPTTATVTTATQATVLFLSRERFAVLVNAVKEIREYIEQLGEERLMDTQLTLDGGDIDDDMLML